jgi:hypothetical protein
MLDRQSTTVHELRPRARIDPLARRYHELLSREVGSLNAAHYRAAFGSQGERR